MKFDIYHAIAQEKWNNPTLLGAGPMSKLSVDAIIELADFMRVPVQLIASRRQIECAELGSGYVNNWSTEDFADYVRSKDKNDWIILARDHGGPWQGTDELELSHAEAMERAKLSYTVDIQSGFDVIHLDPSLQSRPLKDIQHDIEKLLSHCESLDPDIVYECGTEETNGKTNTAREFAPFVQFCSELSPKIKFVVGQTGTLVKELRNTGTFDAKKATVLSSLCRDKGLLFKEHNLDYASHKVLRQHRACKIDAANIAPEIGVRETNVILDAMKRHKKTKMLKRFNSLAIKSGKWKKWSISDLPDADKVMISGHYIFAMPEVQEMYAELNKIFDLDCYIKDQIKVVLLSYLRPFGWCW